MTLIEKYLGKVKIGKNRYKRSGAGLVVHSNRKSIKA